LAPFCYAKLLCRFAPSRLASQNAFFFAINLAQQMFFDLSSEAKHDKYFA
jgi:hypothetical protein